MLRFAIGGSEWHLSVEFQSALKDALHVTVPAYAYWAINYHLDWLYASLVLAADGDEPTFRAPRPAKSDLICTSLALVNKCRRR